MSDDQTPQDPEHGDVGPDRDPAIAELLAVPPLDEITRRRLVAVAVDERPRGAQPMGRRAAVLGIAAALVVGVIVGAGIVTRPDDSGTTAARAPDSSLAASPKAAGTESAAADASGAAPALVPTSPNQLGDLGTVTSLAALRDAITARSANEAGAAPSPVADACVARGPTAFGLGGFTAVGTATLSDAAGSESNLVAVLVGPSASGSAVAVAVTPSDCTIVGTVALQQ